MIEGMPPAPGYAPIPAPAPGILPLDPPCSLSRRSKSSGEMQNV